jgi:hypothetical protein
MGLTAKLFDRRWFWLLIVPAVFYWMIPWAASKPPFTSVQGRFLNLSLVSSGMLMLWIFLRQKLLLHQKVLGETMPQTNWWLEELPILVTAGLVVIVFTLAETLAERYPWPGYALHVAFGLAGGYGFWRMVYWKKS